MLSIKNVSKQFKGHTVLDAVSLDIPKGSITLLLGGSGVGKSTLLRILNNLETIDSGSITIDKEPLASVGKNHIGMVFQNFNLFPHMTVLENITMPLTIAHKKSTQEALNIAQELLKKYELYDKKDRYPSQLSGGQKQRLAIARALALKPNIICMDEPTSALDPLLTSYVAQTITELAHQNYTVIIATHDTALVDKLDTMIYLMKNGSIQESALSTTFLQNKELFPHINAFIAGESTPKSL